MEDYAKEKKNKLIGGPCKIENWRLKILNCKIFVLTFANLITRLCSLPGPLPRKETSPNLYFSDPYMLHSLELFTITFANLIINLYCWMT
jgi:hypothetical protein